MGEGTGGALGAGALTELGPTFIKLGQMLATRADLLGPGRAREPRRPRWPGTGCAPSIADFIEDHVVRSIRDLELSRALMTCS